MQNQNQDSTSRAAAEKRLRELFLKYSTQGEIDAESFVAVLHHTFAKKVTMPEARELVRQYGSQGFLNYEQLVKYCETFGIFLASLSDFFPSF